MVHLSDLDWHKPGEQAITQFKKGERVRVKLLYIDVEKERVSLGIKQLGEAPAAPTAPSYKKGDVVTCTVSAIEDGGIEVTLADGASAFIRKGELARERGEQRPERFAVDEKMDAKITAFDAKTRKLSLSIKAREADEEKQAMADFGSSDSGASLGDILGAAISKAQKDASGAEEKPKKTRKAEAAEDGDG